MRHYLSKFSNKTRFAVPSYKSSPQTASLKMPEAVMEHLKRGMELFGFVQPLILIPADEEGFYVIVDGEHHYKLLKDFNASYAPCIVTDYDKHQAMVQTIGMNKHRVDFDTVKLAEVIVELKKVYSEEEIMDMLGYTHEELSSYDDLLDFYSLSSLCRK
jgi:ParB-like chromosome segregation protein Spo0J